ncbi:hypothetical protein STENM223S_03492 [Streptomyces tendae]
MTRGGKKPPSPPAAPTTPVTEPTRVGGYEAGDEGEHGADPAPRAAAMPRKARVPIGTRGSSREARRASAATVAYAPMSTGTGCNRSESQPPAGRAATARTTKPAVRREASERPRP